MQLFGIVLLAVASAVTAAQLPAAAYDSAALENLEDASWDPTWLSGKSRLLSVGNSSFGNGVSNDEGDSTSCTATYSCLNCKTARVCRLGSDGTYTELLQVQCPPELPYCDYTSGSCTKVSDTTCGEDDSTFVCTKDGYFPDHSVSTIYHVCKDLVPHKFECSVAGEMYNAVTRSCTPSNAFDTFTCRHAGSKVPYHLSHNYFGYCGTTSSSPSVVDKCRGNMKLNETSQQCETICESVGVLPDVDDCSKYFRCDSVWLSSTATVLVKSKRTCPTGTTFSHVDSMCIESASNEYCATMLQ